MQTHLLSDVGVHAIVVLPWLLCGIHIETSSSAEVPALVFPLDVTTT